MLRQHLARDELVNHKRFQTDPTVLWMDIPAQYTTSQWTISMIAGRAQVGGRIRGSGKDHDQAVFGTRSGPEQLVHVRLDLRLKPLTIRGCARCNKALNMLQSLLRSWYLNGNSCDHSCIRRHCEIDADWKKIVLA